MIEGQFERGVARVTARVWLVARDHRARIDFLVDPTSAVTVVSTGDLGGFGAIAMDDLSDIDGTFGVRLGMVTRALLTLYTTDDLPYLEPVEAVVAHGPERASRLGRDILNRWLMIYDRQGDNLSFYPYIDEEDDGDASTR